nr:MAG TPA_asm: Protein of unknown function (DUF3959) [Caudoviricetes sp.]
MLIFNHGFIITSPFFFVNIFVCYVTFLLIIWNNYVTITLD